MTLSGVTEPVVLRADRVSSHFFDIFEIKPAMGRAFLPDEKTGSGFLRNECMKIICTLVLLPLLTITASAQQAVPRFTDFAAPSGLATVLPATSSAQAVINAQAMVTGIEER